MSAVKNRQSRCRWFNAAAISAVVCADVPCARGRFPGVRVHVGAAPG
jgi:hypothetical protein